MAEARLEERGQVVAALRMALRQLEARAADRDDAVDRRVATAASNREMPDQDDADDQDVVEHQDDAPVEGTITGGHAAKPAAAPTGRPKMAETMSAEVRPISLIGRLRSRFHR